MKALSLKAKLFTAALSAILALALTLTWSSYSGITAISQNVGQYSEQTITDAALLQLKTDAQAYGKGVSSYIETAYRVPATLASVLAANSRGDYRALSREQVSLLVRDALVGNPRVSSTYVHFEDNAYDGRDALFRDGDALFNTTTGSLEVYWLRESHDSISEQASDPANKYLSEKNEFGSREAEWYLCPRDNKKPCLMEPYTYELNGQQLPMTSLVYPILRQGEFIGVTGVDLNLPIFQSMMEQLSQSLYGGQAKVSLLSQQGLIVASSHYSNKLTRPLSEAVNNGQALQTLHSGTGVLIEQGIAYVATAVPIEDTGRTWSLLVELPMEVALAHLREFQGTLAEQQTSVLGKQLLLAAVFVLIAGLLITLLIQSIVRPLAALNNEVAQLSSGDGDLTQRLNLDTHAELIRLGSNFNLFLDKLSGMIRALKQSNAAVRDEAGNNLSISQQTALATDQQHSEIHHVVTATQEMSATAQEVSRIASSVSSGTQDIHQSISQAQSSLSGAVEEVLELTDNMRNASESISEVAQRSSEIDSILAVIRGIAEQTNLLALNAAIEAARAGEQGRGFAVVADEVRNLASRTQDSTTEINTMIASLQEGVNQAVNVIEQGTTMASSAMQTTRGAQQSLDQVVQGISEIADNIDQVATAAEEQSSVSDEIAKNLTAIGDAAQTLSELSRQASHSSEAVTGHVNAMDANLAQLRT